MGERNGDAFFNARHGLFPNGIRDEVEGSQLIVLAPAAPVGKFFHVAIDIGFGDAVVRLREGQRGQGKTDGDAFHSGNCTSMSLPG